MRDLPQGMQKSQKSNVGAHTDWASGAKHTAVGLT